MLTKKDLFKIGLVVVGLETLIRWPVRRATADKWMEKSEDFSAKIINISRPKNA